MLRQTNLERLTSLNTDLISTNLAIWNIVKSYCERFGIEIPNDLKLSYRINQALELIVEINGTNPLKLNTQRKHPDDEQNRRIH
jgi:hypothetical protein